MEKSSGWVLFSRGWRIEIFIFLLVVLWIIFNSGVEGGSLSQAGAGSFCLLYNHRSRATKKRVESQGIS